MLTHPTLSRLVTLGLTGMASAFDEQQRQPDITALAFEERFALLVDREATERENKRLVNRLRFAKLRQNAIVEDIDTKAPRGLDKALFQKLVGCDWIERHQNLLIIGPTGATLWACPPGQEKGARRFAAVVGEHAREAAAARQEREGKSRKAESELDSVTRDRSRVEAAEAELARVEADPGLLGAIDDARQRLERARADTPELHDARRKVLELARRVIAPPEPLRVAK